MDSSTKNSSEHAWMWSYDELLEMNATEMTPTDNAPVGIIVLIALAVVLTIGLLFGLAVFIDCRHQKLVQKGKHHSERRLFNISMPKFFKFRRFSNEEDLFNEKTFVEGSIIA